MAASDRSQHGCPSRPCRQIRPLLCARTAPSRRLLCTATRRSDPRRRPFHTPASVPFLDLSPRAQFSVPAPVVAGSGGHRPELVPARVAAHLLPRALCFNDRMSTPARSFPSAPVPAAPPGLSSTVAVLRRPEPMTRPAPSRHLSLPFLHMVPSYSSHVSPLSVFSSQKHHAMAAHFEAWRPRHRCLPRLLPSASLTRGLLLVAPCRPGLFHRRPALGAAPLSSLRLCFTPRCPSVSFEQREIATTPPR